MKKIDGKIESSNMKIPDRFYLSDHTSKWNMNINLPDDKKADGAGNVTSNRKFLSKVYEENLRKTEKWSRDFGDYSESREMVYVMYYPPICAEKYRNYLVVVAEV